MSLLLLLVMMVMLFLLSLSLFMLSLRIRSTLPGALNCHDPFEVLFYDDIFTSRCRHARTAVAVALVIGIVVDSTGIAVTNRYSLPYLPIANR